MPEGLKSALDGIIDYAGLFPPAKLAMPDALAKFAEIRRSRGSWIVSRFVCPANALQELGRELDAQDVESMPLTVVGTGGSTPEVFRSSLEADAEAMMRFDEAHGERAPIEAYEVRSPEDLPSYSAVRDLGAFKSLDVFLELAWTPLLDEALIIVAEQDWLMAKARTGGLRADAFPDSELLAGFLKGALDLDVSFKLTAGLHHPLRHWDGEVAAPMHGFLNILAVCALHQTYDLALDEFVVVLNCEDAKAFEWNEKGLNYQGLRCDWAQIEAARDLFIGFGSCSVEEPLQGLADLGLTQEAWN